MNDKVYELYVLNIEILHTFYFNQAMSKKYNH